MFVRIEEFFVLLFFLEIKRKRLIEPKLYPTFQIRYLKSLNAIINCVLHYDKLLYSRINIISFKNENKWERKLIIEENLILFDTKLKIINY